jgi:hypothetical protein
MPKIKAVSRLARGWLMSTARHFLVSINIGGRAAPFDIMTQNGKRVKNNEIICCLSRTMMSLAHHHHRS